MNRSKQEKKLDDLWSSLIKTDSNFTCQMCGTRDAVIDPHHVIKRGHKRLRWTVNNGIALCRFKCHRLAEDKEKEFNWWFEEKYPYIWEQLNDIKKEGVKHYSIDELEAIESNLKARLKESGEENIPF